ncbi:galactose oxidase [Cyanobium sp. Alchichica 3B3-8F6]|uniref:galactose oxidase n=1 Tax=Cyanobium sp. Alchichica 3B3-8F6 TaxID=2823696 RepID=UPI0020CE6802|nr:galactose oxidase [Cyanobium sp. Alchichica 3B3-8F6]MCP9880877.1 galactose oxidase [Cyanobium sp. Alchichica 3B3-8F6]
MGVPLPRPAALAARFETPVEEWPYLEADTLLRARSRKVCIPVLTCQLHQGLIAHGEHLTSRCQGWTSSHSATIAGARAWS